MSVVCEGNRVSASHNYAEADRADVLRVLAGETAAFEGIVRRWQGSDQSGISFLPRPWSRGRHGARGIFVGLSRSGQMARRLRFFHMVVCPGNQSISVGAAQDSGKYPAA